LALQAHPGGSPLAETGSRRNATTRQWATRKTPNFLCGQRASRGPEKA
jgi:hypothetical protein